MSFVVFFRARDKKTYTHPLSNSYTIDDPIVLCSRSTNLYQREQAALKASQADQRETQRRISKLQELTKALSIIDVGGIGAASAGGKVAQENKCSGEGPGRLQLYNMTPASDS